jgi:DNA (cytosine-5)-methyltransferase 1
VQVRDAIADLAGAFSVGQDPDGYDVWQHAVEDPVSDYARKLRSGAKRFTSHRRTAHRSEIAARFVNVPQGGIDKVGRHHRLRWDGQSPTLRAGTGFDRGRFQAVRPLHPDEPRVITVREAARLQGFPDWFRFHPTTWHSFRMIGNSVSPIAGTAILNLLKDRIDNTEAAVAAH